MATSNAVIYGAGGHARELQFQLQLVDIAVLAYVDDFSSGYDVDNVPVLSREAATDRFPGVDWFIGIGNVSARRRILNSLRESGVQLGSFISPRALVAPTASISHPTQVFANAIISPSATLGENVIVHFGSVIHHDVQIGADSFIAGGVTVAGYVKVECGVWLGVGCTIRNGSPDTPLRIGNGATVGAGACVVTNVPDNAVVVGVPARQRS